MSIPWVEKYRPLLYENIVLDAMNKTILSNIIETSNFPNLLFYGPPGTGKTTTIMNLVSRYQDNHNERNKGLMIHLNGSDERGIDIIRNQINQFVTSNGLFVDGMKFVILDEVDYMTKNAQLALRYLLQNYTMKKVRFCLICNYISRIDEGLQAEFVLLRFNQLPKIDIIRLLHHIVTEEQLPISMDRLEQIQKLYHSDIRSMINYLQSLQNNTGIIHVLHDGLWEELYTVCQRDPASDITRYMNFISSTYNIDKKNIIKYYLNYLILHKQYLLNREFFVFVENVMHVECKNMNHYNNYVSNTLSRLLLNPEVIISHL